MLELQLRLWTEGMGPLVVVTPPAERHDPLRVKVERDILVRMERNRPNVVPVELASLLTTNAPIAIAPKDEHAHTTPPRVTVDRPT